MNVLITPSKLNGTVNAPPSKSYTHRALICAALAKGQSVIKNWLICDDTLSTLEALKKMGTAIRVNDNSLIITGVNGRFKLPAEKVFFDLGNSGTSLRLLTAVSALTDGEVIVAGSKKLSTRPINNLIEALKSLEIKIESDDGLPLKITGGILKGGNISVDSKDSSQYLSALLLVAPFAESPLKVIADNLSSSPYIDITLDVMEKFNVGVERENEIFRIPNVTYKACNLNIEGDYSSASYYLAANNISGNSVKVKNLVSDSIQGDKVIVKLLEILKNKIDRSIDMNNYPDLVPVVAVMAAFGSGKTVIENIAHLKFKESDRISSIVKELSKMGIKISTDGNSLTVIGGILKGAEIETFDDHRIAMSFAIAATNASSPSVIKNSDVVSKSYPEFWQDMKTLGAKLTFLN